MLAEAVFTGTEMLLGQTVNTNAALLGRHLAASGINLYRQVTVGDNLERIVAAINNARKAADMIIIGGGLGPTEDDLAREALAEALGLPLVENREALENITRFFKARGRTMPLNNLKQALVPLGAEILDNPHGTAAGVLLEHKGKKYILLPGPPREFENMVVNRLLPLLQRWGASGEVILSRVIKMTGIGESAVEEIIEDLLKNNNPTLAPLAKPGEVNLRLTARAENRRQALDIIAPLEETIRRRLGTYIFGTDNDTLEGVVGAALPKRRLTLAVAESCTGGLLANRLTNIPGSSAFFLGGFITYSNEAKTKLLGVDPRVLENHGAVSPEVAAVMATGAKKIINSDIGVGITGIAGPSGGTAAKPVGLVYIGLDFMGKVIVHRENYVGERENIKFLSTQSALYLLWQSLVKSFCQ